MEPLEIKISLYLPSKQIAEFKKYYTDLIDIKGYNHELALKALREEMFFTIREMTENEITLAVGKMTDGINKCSRLPI